MKTFLLVIVLGLPPQQPTDSGEQHIAVIMPDEATCQVLRTAFVYAVNITTKQAMNTVALEAEGYTIDPFADLDEPTADDDLRLPLEVLEVRCEVHED